MTSRVEALASTPAGPGLAALLASLDVSKLTGSECVEVMQAQFRQANHERGLFLAAVAEVGRRVGPVGESGRWPGESAVAEIGAALVLTATAAQDLYGLADDLVTRLPAVQAALVAGLIDQPRARVFSNWTLSLADVHTRAIVAKLLPLAPRLTTAQLIKRITTMAMALDPAWAKRRYERAVKQRRVIGYRTREGTANLSGLDLPVDQVAAACDRLDRLARAAKAAGHPDPVDHLRADLFIALIDGSYDGMSEPEILRRLLANHSQPRSGPSPDAGDVPADRPGDAGPDRGRPSSGRSSGRSSGPPGNSTQDKDAADPPAARTGGAARLRPPGRLRLLVRLATLTGTDRRPGEVIGWGPVHAELAQTMAAARHATWCYVLVDAAGSPVSIGSVRSRPRGSSIAREPGRDYRGLQVWVQVNAATLDALAAQPPPGWGTVITEIRAKAERARGAPNDDPAARLPGKALRRWLQVRDRTCVFPGCAVPSPHTDADHTIEHTKGGPTVDTNLASACRRHHRLRHKGKWQVRQPKPGRVTWISKLGRRYHRQPPPGLDDLPDPIPTNANAEDLRHDRELDASMSTKDQSPETCMTHQPPPEPPPPPVAPENDTPPF